MNGSKVAYRYAKSLLEVAQENNKLDVVYNDMIMVNQLSIDSPDLADYITSPIVKSDDKKEVVGKILTGKVDDLSLRFFDLLIENGRETVFHEIAKRFVILYDEIKGIEVAQVVSAIELDSKSVSKIQKIVENITGKKAEIKQSIDESLIGGYILKIGDFQYDASIKSNINRLHSEFRENLYIPKL